MANEKPVIFTTSTWYEDSFGSSNTACFVGNDLFGAGGAAKGAARFASVDINQGQTIYEAIIYFKYNSVGNSGTWKWKAWGVKEANPNTDYPFGRSKTTANNAYNESQPTSGGAKTLNVTSILQEIVNQGSFANGNAVQFLFEDDGSTSQVWAMMDTSNSYLVYRLEALPDFTPTPVTVSAPTLPAAANFGMKFAPSEVNVFTATDAQLLRTTRKYEHKIALQDQAACTGGVLKTIAHNLGYVPQFLCYVRKNSLSMQLPRLFDGAVDPVGGGVQGYVFADADNLYVYLGVSADVYYYIFLDEQAT